MQRESLPIKTRRSIRFVVDTLDLYIFLPIDYWTASARQSIIIALSILTIVTIAGFVVSYLALRKISSRIELLAKSMAEDPFSGPPLLGKTIKRNNVNNKNNYNLHSLATTTTSGDTSFVSSSAFSTSVE